MRTTEGRCIVRGCQEAWTRRALFRDDEGFAMTVRYCERHAAEYEHRNPDEMVAWLPRVNWPEPLRRRY